MIKPSINDTVTSELGGCSSIGHLNNTLKGARLMKLEEHFTVSSQAAARGQHSYITHPVSEMALKSKQEIQTQRSRQAPSPFPRVCQSLARQSVGPSPPGTNSAGP